MIQDDQLNEFREQGTKIRVVRDILEANDVYGIVVAWDDNTVMIRRPNRRIVKLKRVYSYQTADSPRELPEGLLE